MSKFLSLILKTNKNVVLYLNLVYFAIVCCGGCRALRNEWMDLLTRGDI